MSILLALFIAFNKRRHYDSLSITFILMLVSVSVFQISHALGVVAGDADTSRQILMFNLSIVFIAIFMFHWFVALIGKEKELKNHLLTVYVTGLAMFIFFVIDPSAYLVESVPKLYFPFYYEPGPWQIIARVWFSIVLLYGLYKVFDAYRNTTDKIIKNRYLYVFISIFYGFAIGSSAILLVYDLPFDPIWSSLFGLFPIPLAYCVVKYELIDIRIVAKKSLISAVLIVFFSTLIVVANSLSNSILIAYPAVPVWLVPVVLSIIVLIIAITVWNWLKDSELLKYEFVSIITHKFRTPMTRIKWAAEKLQTSSGIDSDDKELISAISQSNEQMASLINALTELSEADNSNFQYRPIVINLGKFVTDIIEKYQGRFSERDVDLMFNSSVNDPKVNADEAKLEFIITTLLDNALFYTTSGGTVTVSINATDRHVLLNVSDTGMGISPEDAQHLFEKFYRGSNARKVHTEGFGIGLYMSMAVARRFGGAISVHSEGLGKGSTFTLTLPRIKE